MFKDLLTSCTLIIWSVSAQRPFVINNGFNAGFNNNNNRFVANTNRAIPNNNNVFPSNNRFVTSDNSFRATPADARDASGNEVYPGCNGTVCLPVANLCATRKSKAGHFNFGGKSYWISWASDEATLRNARWNWFTGRNYCRKMCMDMVSFETKAEEDFISGLMRTTGVKDIHTAGRLCDKEVEGCEQPRFQPLSINGWFWASTLRMMPPTNLLSDQVYNNWSNTGPNGLRQPDGAIRADGFGNEACMALLDNQFGEGGVKWHDEACSTRRMIACEDLPEPNINFVRNQNPSINIP